MYVMRFPGGKSKALTLSYDDGSQSDRKMIEILDRYGIKATFNLNSENSRRSEWHIDLDEMVKLCSKGGHEIACHSKTHPFLEQLPPSNATDEILGDRLNLEAALGSFVRGMAYPFGTFNDTVVEILKNSGIVYSRTVRATEDFGLPSDWLRLDPTCHHDNPRLMNLSERFLNTDRSARAPWLFYLWGHSFEFERNNNWDVLENFCMKMSGRDDVWYATNIEVYDYVKAFESIIYTADVSAAYNPSAIPLYLGWQEKNIEIMPGETVRL